MKLVCYSFEYAEREVVRSEAEGERLRASNEGRWGFGLLKRFVEGGAGLVGRSGGCSSSLAKVGVGVVTW